MNNELTSSKYFGRIKITSLAVLIILALPLTACGISVSDATATPEPTLTPTDAPTFTPTPISITVDQDLAAVIAAADDGDTLRLAPGVFTLAEGIEITKSLNIIGAGIDQTTITMDAVAQDFSGLIKYSGSGALSIQGVKLSYAGTDPAIILQLSSGHVTIQECYLEGATFSSSGSQLGAMYIENDAVVTVTDCQIAGTMSHDDKTTAKYMPGGIIVYGDAHLTVEGSEIFDSHLGVHAFGNADVTIRETTFRNTYAGVSLLENSVGTLDGNTFLDLLGVGFALFGDAAGTAMNNSMNGTVDSIGVQVNENASVHFEQNTIQNVMNGISFLNNATGEIVANEIYMCSSAGIAVQDSAFPLLDSNILRNDYTGIGIMYSGNAAGEATGNQISFIQLGISLDDQAGPVINANTITECVEGIFSQKESFGTITMNTIGFCHNGILIVSPANPTITNNTIRTYEEGVKSDPEEWIEGLLISDNTIEEHLSLEDMNDVEIIIIIDDPDYTPEP